MANRRGKGRVVTDFLFLGLKITVDGDCSHEMRRWLFPGRKAVANLDSLLKSRHHSADKGPHGQGHGVPSGHILLRELDRKEGAECQNTDAFELRCWMEKTPETPRTARRSNQSTLREINPEYLLEGLMLKLKPQYFGHMMGKADSLEKTLMPRKIEGRRRMGWPRKRWLDGITDTRGMKLGKLWEMAKDREESQRVRYHWVTEQQQELTYDVVLVSGIQRSDSVIHRHISFLFQILFPYKLL